MVIISNGFNRFQLANAASAAHRSGALTGLLTGAYPRAWTNRVLRLAGIGTRRIEKFTERRQPLPEQVVYSCPCSEAFYFSQYPLRGTLLQPAADWIDRVSFKLYAWESLAQARRLPAGGRIFHYRAGFGHATAAWAREEGMVLVCDHSLVHPSLVDFLVRSGGRRPADPQRVRPDLYWSGPLMDVEMADYVLVNSEFARQTFEWMGYPPEKIRVLYWGVDDDFLVALPRRRYPAGRDSGPLRFVFAGSLEERKGAWVLERALEELDRMDWRLDIVGPIPANARSRAAGLLARPGVTWHGPVTRSRLAQILSGCDVLIFPSLAEGSARVIFEAMAAGCAIITTPNAGSIVRDGEHGWLVAAGDATALRRSVVDALEARSRLAAIGIANQSIVSSSFREEDYARGLASIYAELSTCAVGRARAI